MEVNFKDESVRFTGGSTEDKPELLSRRAKRADQNKKNGGTFFAGQTMLQNQEDRIAQKKKEAQKQAMKIVGDVYNGEKRLDNDMSQRRQRIDQLRMEKREGQDGLEECNEAAKDLMEKYAIDPEGQEQKDFELLKKQQLRSEGKSTDGFSEEELKRLEELEAKPLTEYQEKAMYYSMKESTYQENISKAEKGILSEVMTLDSIGQERLKKDSMVGAQKMAKSIQDNASKAVMGIITDEAKKHIDEEMKEKEEAAAKKKEEEAEKEKAINTSKEVSAHAKLAMEKAALERQDKEVAVNPLSSTIPKPQVPQEILEVVEAQSDAEKKIREIMQKMKVLEEELKGAAVDAFL